MLLRQRGGDCPALTAAGQGQGLGNDADTDTHATDKDRSSNAGRASGGSAGSTSGGGSTVSGGADGGSARTQGKRNRQHLDVASSEVNFDYQDDDDDDDHDDDNDEDDNCQNFALQAARMYRRVLALDPLSLGPYLGTPSHPI